MNNFYRTDQKYLLLDIDGCLINSAHRDGAFLSGNMDVYHDLHVNDTYIPQGVEVYNALMSIPFLKTYFVTARGEEARDYTEKQLEKVITKPYKLLMRPVLDRRKTIELKPEMVIKARIPFSDIFMVIEDQNSMVKKWRELGVVCYQPADGDF